MCLGLILAAIQSLKCQIFKIANLEYQALDLRFHLALNPKFLKLGGSFLELDPPFISYRDDIMKPLKKCPFTIDI